MKFYSGYSWLHTNTFKNLSQKTPQTCQNPSENTGNQILLLWCYFVLSSHFCIRFWDLSCNSLNSFVLGLPLFLHLPPLPSKLFSSLYNHQGRPDTPATVTIKSSQLSQSPQSSIILVTIVIPGIQIVESGRKIHEENKNKGRLQGEGGRELTQELNFTKNYGCFVNLLSN